MPSVDDMIIRKIQTTQKINVRKWGDGVNKTNKAPTCVLFDHEEKFVSFGYEAMNDFRLNPKEIDYSKWYYFEHFKIKLFKQEDIVTKETMLEESLAIQNPESKKKMYAVDVFAAVISYLTGEVVKEEFMQSKKHKGTKYKLEDIHWVITVPAIWDQNAKLFMQDAARKAGILGKNLTLALEPEAASIYCRRVAVGDSEDNEGCKAIAALGIGSKYVVLDQGGGTTDITVYEVTGKNTLKEIHQACGGHWGGITVTAKFNNFLLRLLGNDVITNVKINNPSDYYQLLYNFEHTKASFTEEHSKLPKDNQTLPLPFSWLDHFQKVTGCDLEDTVKQSMYRSRVSVKRDKMRITNELFRSFFDDSIKNIVKEMENLLKKKKLEGVETILIVGGHSMSTILTNAINKSFGKAYKIVIPKNPDIAVMKGAVLFGFNSRMITSRVSQ
ncbi:heat shock 70 kDa protein 12A-like [Mytilus californianus]|uniref:heat shock 70 kDa protein 12A-like n=1 Tax=Mytilus californianus TaxID=6549 RepID=UPI00224657A2|nr:heat shock 70 kDa protein 12A-like [Mytilus californianus]